MLFAQFDYMISCMCVCLKEKTDPEENHSRYPRFCPLSLVASRVPHLSLTDQQTPPLQSGLGRKAKGHKMSQPAPTAKCLQVLRAGDEAATWPCISLVCVCTRAFIHAPLHTYTSLPRSKYLSIFYSNTESLTEIKSKNRNRRRQPDRQRSMDRQRRETMSVCERERKAESKSEPFCRHKQTHCKVPEGPATRRILEHP